MKALKEKTVSLRALFRRSLFILSMVALAFVIASCGGGDTEYIEVPVDRPVDRPVEVPVRGKYAESIFLMNFDEINRMQAVDGNITDPATATNLQIGFQGLPPDLHGAIISVKWSDEPAPRQITLDRGDVEFFSQWSTDPIAPDTVDYFGPFTVTHFNSEAKSNPFSFDHVFEIKALTVDGDNLTWYSDQRPDLVKDFTAQGTWEYPVISDRDSPVYGAVIFTNDPADPANKGALVATGTDYQNRSAVSRRIPVSMGYPVLDFRQIDRGIIFVQIGSSYPNQASITETALTGVRFMQVTGVGVREPLPANFYVRDDQFKGMEDDPALWRAEIRRLIEANADQLRFQVQYNNNQNETRDINWAEFQANRAYSIWRMNNQFIAGGQANQVVTPDEAEVGLIAAPGNFTVNADPWEAGLTEPGPGDTWHFTLGYVAQEFGETKVMNAIPRLPIWRFQRFAENPVRRRDGSVGTIRVNQQVTGAVGTYSTATDRPSGVYPTSSADVENLLDRINAMWVVEGVYTRNGLPDKPREPMRFVKDMFDKSGPATVTDGPLTFLAWPEAAWGPAHGLPAIDANHALNIQWRKNQSVTGNNTVQIVTRSAIPRPNYVPAIEIRLPVEFTDAWQATWTDKAAVIASITDASTTRVVNTPDAQLATDSSKWGFVISNVRVTNTTGTAPNQVTTDVAFGTDLSTLTTTAPPTGTANGLRVEITLQALSVASAGDNGWAFPALTPNVRRQRSTSFTAAQNADGFAFTTAAPWKYATAAATNIVHDNKKPGVDNGLWVITIPIGGVQAP